MREQWLLIYGWDSALGCVGRREVAVLCRVPWKQGGIPPQAAYRGDAFRGKRVSESEQSRAGRK